MRTAPCYNGAINVRPHAHAHVAGHRLGYSNGQAQQERESCVAQGSVVRKTSLWPDRAEQRRLWPSFDEGFVAGVQGTTLLPRGNRCASAQCTRHKTSE